MHCKPIALKAILDGKIIIKYYTNYSEQKFNNLYLKGGSYLLSLAHLKTQRCYKSSIRPWGKKGGWEVPISYQHF